MTGDAGARRLAYLGTPEVAVAPLAALAAAGHDIRVVLTRPDRRRGRGAPPSPSPVKAEALRLGVPVVDDVDALLGFGAELGIVVAYGRIVPRRVLDALPMLNLHFSLLPRWRGAAPVERAILAGDGVTGVCVMGVEPALDTGPVYACAEVPIGDGEHLGPLRRRLAEVGAAMLVDLLAGPLPEPRAQEGEPTYAEKLAPDDLELHWERPATELVRLVRLDAAWTTWRGRRLRVLDATTAPAPDGAGPPGTLHGEVVVAGAGALRLLRVQPEGRAPMRSATWLRGARALPGERIGPR